MKEKLEKAILIFIQHFGYSPNYPNNIDFDQDEYADLLSKCVQENLDYTIKLYGTVPPTHFGMPSVIID